MRNYESKTMAQDQEVWSALVVAYNTLKAAKPSVRGEHTRRYAVTISLFEHVIAYFHLMVMKGFTSE